MLQTNHKIPLLKKLYLSFWITTVILLIVVFTFKNKPEEKISINVASTNYVIEVFYITLFFACFYFLIGFGYWLVNRLNGRLNRILCYIHALIMIGSMIFYFIANWFSDKLTMNIVMIVSLCLILFIAQPIYVVNLMLGLFNWRKDRKVDL